MIRITADLDNMPLTVARIRALAIINLLDKHFNIIIDRKKIRMSSSKKGCHVILFTNNKLKKDGIFFIRYLLGDDHKRIKKDLKRKRPKQYLFTEKRML